MRVVIREDIQERVLASVQIQSPSRKRQERFDGEGAEGEGEGERPCCDPHRSGLRKKKCSDEDVAANKEMLKRIFPDVPR